MIYLCISFNYKNMIIGVTKNKLRQVRTLTNVELQAIEAYVWPILQNGMAPNKYYKVKDFFGGKLRDWTVSHQPLLILYNKRMTNPNSRQVDKKAHRQAARDLGHIVKNLLYKSSNTYEEDKSMWEKRYKLL